MERRKRGGREEEERRKRGEKEEEERRKRGEPVAQRHQIVSSSLALLN